MWISLEIYGAFGIKATRRTKHRYGARLASAAALATLRVDEAAIVTRIDLVRLI